MTGAVRVRPLRRDDGELLDIVMAGMSDQSRYQRFHGPKPRLTAADRRYLTNVDGHDHTALVALAPDGAPIAVARYVRLKDDPAAAELGVEVVDAWQGRGLGIDLITRLARRAAAEGVERLVARVLDASRLKDGLKRRGWRAVERDGASVLLVADAWAVARSAPAPARPRRAVA
jgi:RimJ/RimL family protein N-acetyltransferase